jgi:hypothetical protein
VAALVTDIWFRSSLSLATIAERLGFEDVESDSEDFWEWVIGTVDTARCDLTRTHTRSNSATDARIFLLDRRPFTDTETAELVSRLRTFISGTITCGRWIHTKGNEFDRIVVQQYEPAG